MNNANQSGERDRSRPIAGYDGPTDGYESHRSGYDGPSDGYDGQRSGYDGPSDGYNPAHSYDGPIEHDGLRRPRST